MKKITFILGFFALLMIFQSCEKDGYDTPDISLTPIYTITDILGEKAPWKINIYKNEPLLIKWGNDKVTATAFETSDFTDDTDDAMINLTLTAKEVLMGKDMVGNDSVLETIMHGYTIIARKDTINKGIIELESTYEKAGTVVNSLYTMVINEKEVYN